MKYIAFVKYLKRWEDATEESPITEANFILQNDIPEIGYYLTRLSEEVEPYRIVFVLEKAAAPT